MRLRPIVATTWATFASWVAVGSRRSWQILSCPCPHGTRKSLCCGAKSRNLLGNMLPDAVIAVASKGLLEVPLGERVWTLSILRATLNGKRQKRQFACGTNLLYVT